MNLPYRTRKRLRTLGIIALSLVLVVLVIWLVWMLWLDRYLVYSREGARLDFSLSAEYLSGQVALPPENRETVTIYYNDGDDAVSTSTELAQIHGYYADTNALSDDIENVTAQIEALPAGTTVMLDVKNIYGYFLYSSQVGPKSDSVDTAAVDALIAYLKSKNIYTIARLPAFRDYYYGLNNNTCGLPHSSGGYLWSDDQNCYWLNPDSSGTMNYLIQIISELKSLGFNEVVFTEFRFPDTTNILYDGDRTESLNKAASYLVSSCATTTFAVSFCTELDAITLPEGRTRLYLQNISAFNVQSTVESCGLEDPMIQLVFITEASDTRYDECSVLRPISYANTDS